MADFFDTSIDVLLGYILKDNRIDATARRLRHCQRVKDLNGLEEAEKALKKYPNSFIIVYLRISSALTLSVCAFSRGMSISCSAV